MKKQRESVDEKALGRIVAAKLREQLKGVSPGCPDTETLAAFYDRTLTDREQAVWEEHLLTCLHCQGYVAEFARLSDVDEPPEAVEAEAALEEPKQTWTFRLAWAMPLLIVIIGSAIWFREDIVRMVPRSREIAQNEPEPLLVPDEAPTAAAERDVGVMRDADQAPVGRQKTLAKSAAPPAAERAAEDARASSATAAMAEGARESEAPAGPIATPTERAELRDTSKPADRPHAAGEERKDQAASRFAAAPAMKAQSAEAPSTLARKSSELSGVTVQGAAQRATPKWRVGRRGTIQRADEAGGWVNVPSGVEADLFDITFAGSAGWAVGYEGTVLRSTDGGNTWRKVSAPTNQDLVRVSAQSAQQARVVSRSGEFFSTTDGGRSWQAASNE